MGYSKIGRMLGFIDEDDFLTRRRRVPPTQTAVLHRPGYIEGMVKISRTKARLFFSISYHVVEGSRRILLPALTLLFAGHPLSHLPSATEGDRRTRKYMQAPESRTKAREFAFFSVHLSSRFVNVHMTSKCFYKNKIRVGSRVGVKN